MDGITDLYNMDGLLIVLSGPSGVGKGTICKELIRVCPDLKMSVSVTTRPPRQGEVEGIHYLFRTEEEFKELIEKEQLLEYAHVFESAYYGTPKNYVFNMLQQGHDVLLEIDVVGAKQVRGIFRAPSLSSWCRHRCMSWSAGCAKGVRKNAAIWKAAWKLRAKSWSIYAITTISWSMTMLKKRQNRSKRSSQQKSAG